MTDDLIARLLEAGGLVLAPGQVEIFPQGSRFDATGSLRIGQRLRIPFGRDVVMLDPYEGTPMARDNVSALKKVRQMFDDGWIHFLDLEELEADAARIGKHRRSRRKSKRRRSVHARGYMSESIARLDEFGLEREGQLNEAVFAKAVHYRRRLLSLEEALAQGRSWLDARHNGKSTTYNRDPNEAYEKLGEVTNWVYANWTEHQAWPQEPGLSDFEAALIEMVTDGPGFDIKDQDTGESIPRFKVQHVIFEVLKGMKQWVMAQSIHAGESVVARHPEIAIGTPEFDGLWLEDVRWFWPRPPVPLFLVQNPYAFRVSIEGVSEHTLNAIWRVARATQLFLLHRGSSADAHRAQTFSVLLDFGMLPGWGAQMPSLAAALVQNHSRSELLERYSPAYVGRILREGRADITRVCPGCAFSDVTEYISWRLKGACARCAVRPPLAATASADA